MLVSLLHPGLCFCAAWVAWVCSWRADLNKHPIPAWLSHCPHQLFHVLRADRLTSSLHVQRSIRTSDRQIFEILGLILDKPSNIFSLHKSLKHLGSTNLLINLKQYGFFVSLFTPPASVKSRNIYNESSSQYFGTPTFIPGWTLEFYNTGIWKNKDITKCLWTWKNFTSGLFSSLLLNCSAFHFLARTL